MSLYWMGMMLRYENRKRIRKARKGMENGVNMADTRRAIRINVLSSMRCTSIFLI